MTAKLTRDEFINRANIIHDNKYLYDKTIYTNNKTKLCIVCPLHGEFWQSPHVHIRDKCGCAMCGNYFTHTRDSIIKKFSNIHGTRYNYSLINYKNALTKIEIVCDKHGTFWQTPADHYTGHGCAKCKSDKATYSWIEIYALFLEKHETYYSYDESTYLSGSIKMRMICPEHGDFWQKPEIHKSGSGCKICTASGGPGKYCETIFQRNLVLKETTGYLYFLKLLDTDGTIFYKIGITKDLDNRIVGFTLQNSAEVLWYTSDTLYNCFLTEQHIIEENRDYKYIPINLPNGGRNECLTIEIKKL